MERNDDKVSITSGFSEVKRADESVPITVGEMVKILIQPHLKVLCDVCNPIMHENLLDFHHHAAFDTLERALFSLPQSVLPEGREELIVQLDKLRHKAIERHRQRRTRSRRCCREWPSTMRRSCCLRATSTSC